MESGRDVCPVHTYDQTAMLVGPGAAPPPLMMLPRGAFRTCSRAPRVHVVNIISFVTFPRQE